MVDSLRTEPRTSSSDIKSFLERPEIAEALKKGNIFEVFKSLPSNVTIDDIKNYLRDQWRTFASQVVQETPAYAGAHEYAPPDPSHFEDHQTDMHLASQDCELFTDSLVSSMSKAIVTAKDASSQASTSADGTSSQGDLVDLANQTLADWQNFMEDAASKMIDSKMALEYKNKLAEVERELKRIVALHGSPELILLALAKVNATKNGVLMSWLGKKAYYYNEEQNKISADLKGASAMDFGTMQSVQNKTREAGFQLQFVMSDLQKVMQDVGNVLEFASTTIKELGNFKSQLISNQNK